MGIKNLRKILKKIAAHGVKHIDFYKEYAGKSVAIDINSYLYKMVYNMETKGKNYYLKGVTEIINDLLKHNIMPIFIFDGAHGKAKDNVILNRQIAKEKKQDAISYNMDALSKFLELSPEVTYDDLEKEVEKALSIKDYTEEELLHIFTMTKEIIKNKKNIITVTKEMYRNTEHLLNLWGVPWFRADGEADFLCARLSHDGYAAAVISEDMDIITHGCDKLLTGFMGFQYLRTKELEQFDLNEILIELDITHEQFIDFCIMLGCDYCKTIKDVGPVKGLHLLLKHGAFEHFPKDIEISDDIYAARAEFYKHKDEDYDEHKIKLSTIKEAELIAFLLEHTSYKRATIIKKISEVRTV